MLRIICVLVILDAYNGHLTQEDGWKQVLHRVRRNYASQSQYEKSATTEDSLKPHSLNQPVFGTRLKPRIKMYFDYPIETNKSTDSDTHTLLRRRDADRNSENLSSAEYNIQISKLTDYKHENKSFKIDDKYISAIGASNKQNTQNLLESQNKNSFELYDLTSAESEGFGNRVSRDYFGINYRQDPQNKNVNGLKDGENLFGTKSNQKPKSLLSFRSSNRHNGQYDGYGWKKNQNQLKTSLRQILYPQHFPGSQKALESNCNVTSSTLFLRKPGSDSVNIRGQIPFKAPDYLPPVDKTTTNTRDSKKPCCNGKPSIITFTTTQRPNIISTSRRPYYTIDKITKNPSHTTTRPTTSFPATTKKSYYIPFDKQIPKTTKRPYCHACSSTSGPFYIPVPKPSTTIPGSPKTDRPDAHKTSMTTTTSRPVERGDVSDNEGIKGPTEGEVESAMAMPVPTEPDESIPKTMSPTTTMSSSPSTTTTKMPSFKLGPASAVPVPPEPKESLTPPASSPTTTITPSPSTTSTATPMTTKTTIQTIPSDDNRQLEDSGSTTSMITETMTEVAPAMAMTVPTEPHESIPTTITITPSPSTTSTATPMTTKTTIQTIPSDDNRQLEDSGSTTSMITETMTTTTNNMTEVTTPMPYRGPQYLPPKMSDINTTSADPAPARAMYAPPEPDLVSSTDSSPTSMSPADTFRAAEPSNTTTIIPDTNPFKAPAYLPPQESFPPKPAMAKPVTSEPECSLDSNDTPDIDQRSFIKDPCSPTPKPPTKIPFKGPLYLPPMAKSRIGRSSNKTLRLGDLTGTPRPVWYAGIYMKTTNPYLPICGGSIIREDVVISAAHCFWDDGIGLRPAKLFAVAARKIYKPYNDPMDKKAQKSDVLDIKIPPRFLGAKTSFQEDLAIVKLVSPFTFSRSVYGLRPICVDFDVQLDRQQMRTGHYGTVAGWGYTDAAGTHTQRLLWLELPYVEIEKCIRDSDDSFLKYITCDKVCAGENDTGKALCKGDSGGGLAFWGGEPGHATPYLRGIASTSPKANAECNVYAYASFTHVRAHRTFLKDHVPDIENCRFWG